jgi:E3 ubiquitin-protein ligase RNF144
VKAYVDFEINQGAYNISCPDAQCPKQGIIQLEEIEALVSIDEIEKHQRYRLNKGKSKTFQIYKI